MMRKISPVANKRIWSKTRKEERRLSLFRACLLSLSADHFDHSSFVACVCVFVGLLLDWIFLSFNIPTHDRQLNSRDDPNICLYLARQMRSREIYHSTPSPILFIVVLSTVKRKQEEVDLAQIVFHLLNRDMQLWTTTCMTLSLTRDKKKASKRERNKKRMTLACFAAFFDKNVTHFH